MGDLSDEYTREPRTLTEDEEKLLAKQDESLVGSFKATKFVKESKKHWDLFYKRNEERFFRDRNWTLREFYELRGNSSSSNMVLLEVGCGVGNFIFPLMREGLADFIYACDISFKAIELVKENKEYNPGIINAFQIDVSTTR